MIGSVPDYERKKKAAKAFSLAVIKMNSFSLAVIKMNFRYYEKWSDGTIMAPLSHGSLILLERPTVHGNYTMYLSDIKLWLKVQGIEKNCKHIVSFGRLQKQDTSQNDSFLCSFYHPYYLITSSVKWLCNGSHQIGGGKDLANTISRRELQGLLRIPSLDPMQSLPSVPRQWGEDEPCMGEGRGSVPAHPCIGRSWWPISGNERWRYSSLHWCIAPNFRQVKEMVHLNKLFISQLQ